MPIDNDDDFEVEEENEDVPEDISELEKEKGKPKPSDDKLSRKKIEKMLERKRLRDEIDYYSELDDFDDDTE